MRFESLIIVLFFSVTSLLGQNLGNFPDSAKAWNLHYQFTMVEQYHPAFHAVYDGLHSLSDASESAMTITSTVFAGCRLWPGCSAFCNPEIAGGKGLSSSYGAAGFPNGESFRVSDPTPALNMARFFIRQRINLNTDKMDTLADNANQVWEKTSLTGITITMGKIALTDIFDNNRYSHDPRTQFLNWSLMDEGAWDFPADTRGYTYAFVVEYNLPQFSFRGAISAVPTVANGPELEFRWGKAAGYTFESEYRNSLIDGRPGVIRALVFENQTKAGNYNNAIEAYENGTDTTLNVNSLSNYGGTKTGLNINVEQEIASGLGAFLRLSWNDGHFASWAFTEIDRSLSIGIDLSGSKWKRGNDDIGLAISINGISNDHQRFLEAGGLGFIIGDGKLIHYKTEDILEMYYQAKIVPSVFASVDYQLIGNPAYNGDRGPVNVFSARVHVEL